MERVSDILRRKGEGVFTIEPSAPLTMALVQMAETDVGSLVVVCQGKVVGLLAERDCARRATLRRLDPDRTSVHEVMNRSVAFIAPDASVEDALRVMTEARARHLPVLEAQGRLVGLVSIGDCVKSLIEAAATPVQYLESVAAPGLSGPRGS